jgi:hypothetical protein
MAPVSGTHLVRRSSVDFGLAAVIGALLLVSAAGCGSSESNSVDTRGEVEDVVRHALTSGDPAVCQHAMTLRYLNQNFARGKGDPLGQCRYESRLPGEPFGREVGFKSRTVTGDHAVVIVTVRGGFEDGSTARFEVRREGAVWRLDHLAAIRIDRPRFDAAGRREGLAQGATTREASCAMQRLDRFYGTDRLERAIVAGRTDDFSAAEVVCLGRRTLVKEFRLALRVSAPKELPDQLVDCIGRRLTKAMSTNLLRALFAAEDKLSGYLRSSAIAAAKACNKDAEAGLLPTPAAS